MSVSKSVSSDGKILTISVSGRFDFAVHKDFRDAYKDFNPKGVFRVDLSGTEYMDSSALGMLLLLKKHAEEDKNRVVIENASEDVSRILKIANFDKLFCYE